MSTRKKRIIVSTIVSLLALFLVSGTLAYWTVTGTAVNVITTGTMVGNIKEDYTQTDGVMPGDTVKKVVNITNTGTMDMVVRVKISKVWGDVVDGNFKEDATLNKDMILIDYDTQHWLDGKDGYFYYKGVLKAGETTAAPLFNEFKVSEEIGSDYAGKTAHIIVDMECLQAGGDAITSWNKTFSDLGITYIGGSNINTTTKIVFSKDKKFAFDPTTTDLFSDFKSLLPGETRVQTISVTNSYQDAEEIFLRALVIDQDKTDAETLRKVNLLIKQYCTIVITDSTAKTIYTGPVWGNPEGGSGSMKDYISLGSFKTNETKNLTVTLKVDPNMGNEYLNLSGKIKWEVMVKGDDPTGQNNTVNNTTTNNTTATNNTPTENKTTTATIETPKTGDTTFNMYVIVIGTALLALAIVYNMIRKLNKEEQRNKNYSMYGSDSKMND